AIPSDKAVLDAYDRGLEEDQAHHTCTDLLIQAILAHGGEVLASARSDWQVSRERHPYLWECLLHFIGMGVASRVPHLEEEAGAGSSRRVDLEAWVQRARLRSPTLVAHNVDLLAR
ncbi:unnamed protein product, partial [Discosporangium mesarthrocarpum]